MRLFQLYQTGRVRWWHANGRILALKLIRLDPQQVKHWLESYQLGDVWRMGALGAKPMSRLGIKIFVEGGGDKKEGKAAIRQGMGELLKEVRNAASHKRLGWNVIACGSRNETFRKFIHEIEKLTSGFAVLLVDSEDPVRQPPRLHLMERDHWDMRGVNEDSVHLMIQTMETWIVSDVNTLSKFYGNGFQEAALPSLVNLESRQRHDIERALKHATQGTTKGEYHKIRHAGKLLGLLTPTVIGTHCPSCRRLFDVLQEFIDSH